MLGSSSVTEGTHFFRATTKHIYNYASLTLLSLPNRKKLNVTFWGAFAEDFEKSYTDDLEQPVFLIIASAKISAWHGNLYTHPSINFP